MILKININKKTLFFLIFYIKFINSKTYEYNIYYLSFVRCYFDSGLPSKIIHKNPKKVLNITFNNKNSNLCDGFGYTSKNFLKLLFDKKSAVPIKELLNNQKKLTKNGNCDFLPFLISLTINNSINTIEECIKEKNDLENKEMRHIFATGSMEDPKISFFNFYKYLKFNKYNADKSLDQYQPANIMPQYFWDNQKLLFIKYENTGYASEESFENEIPFKKEVKENLILIELLKQYNYKIGKVGCLQLKLCSIFKYINDNKIELFIICLPKGHQEDIEKLIEQISIEIEVVKTKQEELDKYEMKIDFKDQYAINSFLKYLMTIKNILEKSIIYIENISDIKKLQNTEYLNNLYNKHENNENNENIPISMLKTYTKNEELPISNYCMY